jgi:hypothetical protein
MSAITKEQLIEDLKASTQNSSGMFEIGEDTICALMSMLTNAAPQLPQPAVPECYQRLLKHAYGMTMGHDWNKGTMACHHREKLCKAVEDCRAAMLQGAEPAQGWIPCSERMPGDRESVLLWDIDLDDACSGHYSHQTGNFYQAGMLIDNEITHWMPLPAAPQQEVTK